MSVKQCITQGNREELNRYRAVIITAKPGMGRMQESEGMKLTFLFFLSLHNFVLGSNIIGKNSASI